MTACLPRASAKPQYFKPHWVCDIPRRLPHQWEQNVSIMIQVLREFYSDILSLFIFILFLYTAGIIHCEILFPLLHTHRGSLSWKVPSVLQSNMVLMGLLIG